MTKGRETIRGREKQRRKKAASLVVSPDEIEQLVRLMEANRLVEMEVQTGRGKIKLVRENNLSDGSSRPLAEASVRRQSGTPEPGPVAITAPMVGTFHRALSRGAGPLAEVGDVVNIGTVLGVIEAMKMMNEIEAESKGRIKQVLVEDGKPVEYGQPLFLIEPVQ